VTFRGARWGDAAGCAHPPWGDGCDYRRWALPSGAFWWVFDGVPDRFQPWVVKRRDRPTSAPSRENSGRALSLFEVAQRRPCRPGQRARPTSAWLRSLGCLAADTYQAVASCCGLLAQIKTQNTRDQAKNLPSIPGPRLRTSCSPPSSPDGRRHLALLFDLLHEVSSGDSQPSAESCIISF
jgi:hypothetical protein